MKNLYITYIQDKLKNNFDLHFRTIELDFGCVYIAFINSICDEKRISKYIIEPMLSTKKISSDIDVLKNEVITASTMGDVKDEEDALQRLIHGNVVMAFDFSDRAIYCEVRKFETKAIDIPPTEAVLKGPREGFTESLMINISLIRKQLKDVHLKCEMLMIGEKADIEVVFVYIENVAPSALVNHVKKEVGKLNKGFVLQSGHISEQLATKRTAFDTVAYTEKPDVFCTKISEGKVGVILQGDPAGISVPCFFMEKFQSPSDYSALKYIGNFTRVVRWFSFLIAMFVPGLYIAIGTHHYSLVPRLIAFRLAISRTGVPFPLFLEYLLLAIFFQILREGGIRLPQPIGQSISIVGALILGDAAVNSGLASNVTVLIVALCAIASFLTPAISEAIIIWSSLLLVLSALMGLPGFYVGVVAFFSHLAGLKSCGYPYLFPLGTLKRYKFKDRILRGNLNEISNNIFEEAKDDE